MINTEKYWQTADFLLYYIHQVKENTCKPERIYNMKISKAIVDSNIRTAIFNALNVANIEGFHKINDRQYGCIIEDVNGERRYARVGVIVAEQREDVTADELMASEITDYEDKQAKKAERAAARAEKAAKDKAKREAAKKEKEGE